MEDFKLDLQISKAIVDGTLKGYLQYLEERREKKESMNVSGAYAWTKGNHIDDQVSKMSQTQDVQFQIVKAGFTWEYLQFTVNNIDDNFMVIVKNSKRVQKSFDELRDRTNNNDSTNYLANLADINTDIFEDRTSEQILQPEQIQLELNGPEEIKAVFEGFPLTVNQNYSRFYIVTYEIDDETKLISSIKLTMPNSQTMNLELVEDLTYLIQESEFEVTSDDVTPIINEKISENTIFSGDANAFGYSVPEEEKRDEN